jgi:Fe2+ or Zn2+ uptake regulation protein
MLFGMARKRQADFQHSIYHFICNHVQATGEFPKTYFIAERMNLNYETVYTNLKALEERGLIESTQGKRWAGYTPITRRVRRPVTRQNNSRR